MNTEAANKMIDAINENAGYEYISDRESEINDMAETRDSIEDFKKHQKYLESRNTSNGVIEVFELPGSRELQVMDFGDFRLALKG